MHTADDGLVKRIRDTVLRMAHSPMRALEPATEMEDKTRQSVRHLARSRVSQLLRQLRAAHGLTYADVQAQTGLSQQMLFDVEYKDRRLTLDELRTLAVCYGVEVNDVLGVDME
ncbi:MAG: helix-turn-helix transcriptional regulator [Caldilineaceae bacterium]|nr:helix-turn-helix transcriptional regulator [Caldilineaceae bacterium]